MGITYDIVRVSVELLAEVRDAEGYTEEIDSITSPSQPT